MARTIVSKRKPQVPAEDTAAFGPIAERFRRAGDLDRAVSLCREGLQKFPDHISARVTLGWSLLDLGKYNEARTELEAVLRRAPDNLSAIRGLAELHDRSEHTMDLPMDGPGQWPPDASTLDELDQTAAMGAEEGPGGDIVDEAVWVPVRAVDEHDELDGPGRENPAGPAVIAPPELGLAMWSSVPAVEPELGPLVSTASGFGSVREIDPHAGDVSLAAVEEMARANADIEALIAEADSLEAAADVASIEAVESMEPSLVLDAGLDLANLDDVALSMPAEPASGIGGRAELTAGADATVEQATGLDQPVGMQAAVDSATELTAGFDVPTELTAGVDEPVDMSAAVEEAAELTTGIDEPVEAAGAIDAPQEWIADPVAGATAPVLDEVVMAPGDASLTTDTWQLTAEEPFALTDEEPSVLSQSDEGEAPTDAFQPELVELPLAAAVAEAPVHVAKVFTLSSVIRPDQARSPIPALERLLVRVQARRRLLVAESVA